MDQFDKKARAAVENLLFQCAEGKTGDTILIVHETTGHDYYDANLHCLISVSYTHLTLPTNREV